LTVNTQNISSLLGDNNANELDLLSRKIATNVAGFVENLDKDNADLDKILKELTVSVIEASLGSVAGLFVNAGKIYLQIKQKTALYLKDEKNQTIIVEKISGFIQEKSISDLIALIPEKNREDLIIKLKQQAIHKKVTYVFCNKVNELDIYEVVSGIIPDFSAQANRLCNYSLALLIEKIEPQVKGFIEGSMEADVSDLLNKIGDETRAKLEQAVVSIAIYALAETAPHIAVNLDITKIIEEKLMALDMRETEEMIVSVVSKELRAITLVGGVLGFIIGLVPLVLAIIN